MLLELIILFFSIGINPEIRKRSYGETSQFQENFEVYIQALISQCLDANFLDEVFNDAGKWLLLFLYYIAEVIWLEFRWYFRAVDSFFNPRVFAPFLNPQIPGVL